MSFYGQITSGTLHVRCYAGDISHPVRPAVECQYVDCCMYRVSLNGTSIKIQVVRVKMQCLDILV